MLVHATGVFLPKPFMIFISSIAGLVGFRNSAAYLDRRLTPRA